MNLTDEEHAILAHRVVDPDAWVAHALTSKPGEAAVRAKIEKYREPYLTELTNRGVGYKTRAERQANIDAVRQAEIDAALKEAADKRAIHEADLLVVLDAMPTPEAKGALARLLTPH